MLRRSGRINVLDRCKVGQQGIQWLIKGIIGVGNGQLGLVAQWRAGRGFAAKGGLK